MRFSTTRSSASYGGVLTNYTPFSWIKSYKCGYYCSPLHHYVDAGVGLLVSSRFLPSCKNSENRTKLCVLPLGQAVIVPLALLITL